MPRILLTLLSLSILVLWAGLPFAAAQSQQQIDELCEELRKMDAEMGQVNDPQLRQMMQQFAQMRQQCAPGFAAKRAAQTPVAPPSAYGRYRLVVDQQRQLNYPLPDGSANLLKVYRAQVEFTIAPNQREFQGAGTMHHMSAEGAFMSGNCYGRFKYTPVTHPARANVRMNPDGKSLFILIDDVKTEDEMSLLSVELSCPKGREFVSKQLVIDDDIFVKNLPLRHGAQVTEVSQLGGARNTVTARLEKL